MMRTLIDFAEQEIEELNQELEEEFEILVSVCEEMDEDKATDRIDLIVEAVQPKVYYLVTEIQIRKRILRVLKEHQEKEKAAEPTVPGPVLEN